MCKFFACIVTKTGGALFTESESHEKVVLRSGLVDDLKHFVRAEYTAEVGYSIDERAIPEWYERIAAKAEEAVKATYDAVQPAWVECCNNIELLLDVYRDTPFSQLSGFCIVKQPAYKNWEKVRDAKWAGYKKAKNSELTKYKDKISDVLGYLA